jgi:pSer/pThr/pTyr-binding forkhead associated (FHA) protein
MAREGGPAEGWVEDMARLVIFDDRVRGLELPNRPIFIGRSKKNDLPLSDGLLSRKHCSIVPVGRSYRLLDLKSSNGTYLNGKRIERTDLAVDDIIEIGRTVMVFLEDGVWSRGEGLAELRNPLKAQELIARIKLHHRSRKGDSKIPQMSLGEARSDPGSVRSARKARKAARAPAAVDPSAFPDFPQALEDFIVQRAVLILSRSSPHLRQVIRGVLRDALEVSRAAAVVSPAEIRERVRQGLKARLGGGKGVSPAEKDEPRREGPP